jgi:hypothetical protein
MQTEPPKADPPKRNRRWFQLSLRTLMIVVTLTAALCGYLGGQVEIVRARKSLLTWLIEIGGAYSVPADDEIPFPDGYDGDRLLKAGARLLKAGDTNRAPPKLREFFGDRHIDAIWLPSDTLTAEVVAIGNLFPESEIRRSLSATRLQPAASRP